MKTSFLNFKVFLLAAGFILAACDESRSAMIEKVKDGLSVAQDVIFEARN